MTKFKKGDKVAWIVKYIKHDTTHAAIHDGVSVSLETSPGSTVLVHNPQLHPASALDVNKELLAELQNLRRRFHAACIAGGSDPEFADAACASADKAIAASKKGV